MVTTGYAERPLPPTTSQLRGCVNGTAVLIIGNEYMPDQGLFRARRSSVIRGAKRNNSARPISVGAYRLVWRCPIILSTKNVLQPSGQLHPRRTNSICP